MFDAWLAGFFDGDGSVTIRVRKDNRYKKGYRLDIRIRITQKDRKVLEYIREKLGFGTIERGKGV